MTSPSERLTHLVTKYNSGTNLMQVVYMQYSLIKPWKQAENQGTSPLYVTLQSSEMAPQQVNERGSGAR